MFKVCAYVLGVVASPIRQGSSCSGGCLPEKIVFVPTNSPLEAACPHEKHHTSLRASVWMTGCAPTGMRIWSFGFGCVVVFVGCMLCSELLPIASKLLIFNPFTTPPTFPTPGNLHA